MIKVILKPEKGIQIDETKKYLFDPSVVQPYVDASAENAAKAEENANKAEQTFDDIVVFVDNSKQEINVAVEDGKAQVSEAIETAKEDVKQAALDAAQEAINDAAAQAVAIVEDYTNNEVKPELMAFVTSADEDSMMAAESAEKSRKWAEGSDTEVIALGGEHSSKTWSGMAKQYATSAQGYASSSENSARIAQTAASQASQASGKIIQIGFDGTIEDGKLVFKHVPSGVEIPYELFDDYEYELDLSFSSLEDLSNDVQMYVKNGANTITFVSSLHRDSTSYATVGEMSSVMRFNEDTGYRWLFKAAYKITPAGKHVLLLYPVISSGGSSGSGLEIGDIGIAPLGIDETQNKRRYLNGQVISQVQFVSFTNKIKEAVALYPNIATTEENWQAEVTNSKLGQCGKFVIDDEAGTIRLPKVVNIQGLSDLALMGSIKAESLPNITGEIQIRSVTNGSTVTGSGVFTLDKHSGTSTNSLATSSNVNNDVLTFNASNSSSSYQNNAPVQQEAVQYPYFIQVATGVEESVDVTREIELNNPFSLLDYKWSEYEITNASWLISNGAFHSGATYVAVYELLLKIYNGTETKDGVSVKLSTEAYTDTDFVLNTADTTFRLPIKVKLASGNAVVGNGMTLGLTNGTNTFGTGQTYVEGSGNYFGGNSRIEPNSAVSSSEVSGGSYSLKGIIGVTTDPLKSGIETSSNGLKLYFYVGETIQDANVIAASQVLTEISNLKAHSIVETYVNGTSWYRVYSDGWCEQGGHYTHNNVEGTVTTAFIKPFINTNYNLQITKELGSDAASNTNYQFISSYVASSKTTSQFQVRMSTANRLNGYDWQACGYIR